MRQVGERLQGERVLVAQARCRLPMADYHLKHTCQSSWLQYTDHVETLNIQQKKTLWNCQVVLELTWHKHWTHPINVHSASAMIQPPTELSTVSRCKQKQREQKVCLWCRAISGTMRATMHCFAFAITADKHMCKGHTKQRRSPPTGTLEWLHPAPGQWRPPRSIVSSP